MAFLQLSRELRDNIYQALLCPPQGVHLHPDPERSSREREEAELNGEYDDSDNDLECDSYGGDKFDRAYSVSPIPVAILGTNRQLYAEVSPVLYGSNRFTFNGTPNIALRFLKRLPPALRSHIKHLSFTKRATAADDADCTEFWNPLRDFISQHMQITSVTIQLPHDQNRKINKNKASLPSPNVEWFWWPAVHNLTGMLMEKKIQRLRLAYTVTYLRPGEDDDLEGYEAIDYLRTPYSQEERARDNQEYREYQEASEAGRPPKFLSLTALRHDQERRRRRLDFVVSREDDSVGDIGTVLVLTRPDKRSKEASAR